jgi:ribosomal protein L9
MTKIIHNVETGKITEVELTAKEIKDNEAQNAEFEAKKAARIAAAESRKQKLMALGLTEEELLA